MNASLYGIVPFPAYFGSQLLAAIIALKGFKVSQLVRLKAAFSCKPHLAFIAFEGFAFEVQYFMSNQTGFGFALRIALIAIKLLNVDGCHFDQ